MMTHDQPPLKVDLMLSKIVACVENKEVVPWHQALAGYATGTRAMHTPYKLQLHLAIDFAWLQHLKLHISSK